MNRTFAALAVAAGSVGSLLGGCSSRTDVSMTGNTPAKYSHVWLTAQAVWFNSSASAGPDEGGWVRFPLSKPATVDLVAESGGNLGSLITGLKLTPGSYAQLRLIPLDAAAPLAQSAQTAGALYNAEADYVDSAGITHQLPLELLNPAQGVGISGSLRVPVGNLGAALAATSGGSGTTVAVTSGGTSTTSTSGASSASTPTTSFAVSIDGVRDLTPFTYAGATAPNAILLSSHASAFDLSAVGGIQGELTLTNLSGIAGASGLPQIQASAEMLSADGSRHVVVMSTPVHADGSFLLYPLATSRSNPADYDLVIHGPGIATIIVKSVQVTLSSASTASSGASTTTSGVNAVSVGTLIPRTTGSFSATLGSGTSLPAGAQLGFYQTLAAAGEVPYLIAASPIDPFNQVLADPQALSAGTIDSGTYSSSGTSVTLVSAAPHEGAGHYLAAAAAPGYEDGAFSAPVSMPASGTAPVSVTVPGLTLAAGASSGSISATMTQATANKYDHGELLVSHDGTLVATAPLDAALAQAAGATLNLSGLPAGTAACLYYLEVRAWNSSDPAGTLQRQSYQTAIDLRGATSGSVELTID